MPDLNFQLRTEYSSLSKVLIVDEIGEFSTLLVDSLLSHGCLVNYFGKEARESFYYLEDKKNFSYLEKIDEDVCPGSDYLFYFPSEGLSKIDKILSLTEKFSAKLLVCAQINLPQKKVLKELFSPRELNARIVYFDSLFGPRIKSGFLGRLFVGAVEGKQVQIDEDQGREIYPLYSKELIKELMRLVFSAETEKKEYFLQTPKTTPYLFSSMLKNYFPLSDFIFTSGRKEPEIDIRGLEKIGVDFNLEEKLQETADWFKRNFAVKELAVEEKPVGEKQEVPEEQIEGEPKSLQQPKIIEEEGRKLDFLFTDREEREQPKLERKPSLLKRIFLGVFLFLLLLAILFVIPIGIASSTGLIGARKIIQIRKAVEEGDFSSAIKNAQIAKQLIGISRKTVLVAGPFYELVGFNKQVEVADEFFTLSENLVDSLKFSLLAAQQTTSLARSFVSGEEVKWGEALGLIRANLSFAYEQSSLAQAGLEKVEPGFKWLRQSAYFDQIKLVLPQLRKILLKGENLLTVLPKILGLGDKRTYLVLLQNNMEIRPTGGFIGSYGIVRLENGKLTNFEVFDVYQADGQLKGHVEPPPKLKEYLGEAAWYLRDSNWDPDFPVSAKRAQWFLDKEMQITSEGTIAVNLEMVRKVVSALGEIEVPDYREKVNQENLFQKAEYYSELGTFPGSSQKKDFLGSLARMLFETAKQAEGKRLVNLCGALFASLDQKEMMFYFNDQEVESVIANLEWEGSIRNYQPAVATSTVFTDYLSLVEANVGIDKANYYVKRNIDQEISIDQQGKIQEKLTLTYENQSPSESWPAGRYKNYLRAYLKKGAKLSSAFISDPTNIGLWLPFDIKYIDEAEDHGKTVFGFLFDVPIKSQRKLEINFELPDPFDFSKKITTYLFMAQKQSGAFPSNYDLTISYPANFIPLRVIPSAVVGNQQLLISSKFTKDLIYQIDLAH